MIQKLKDITYYALLPIGALLAGVWYLLTKNRVLRSQVEGAKIASEMKDLNQAATEAVAHAKDKKSDLLDRFNEFKRDLGDGS